MLKVHPDQLPKLGSRRNLHSIQFASGDDIEGPAIASGPPKTISFGPHDHPITFGRAAHGQQESPEPEANDVQQVPVAGTSCGWHSSCMPVPDSSVPTHWTNYTFSPENVWWERWAFLTVVAALVTGWVSPFLLAFGGSEYLVPATWDSIQWVLTGVFALDLVLKFAAQTEDADSGALIKDLRLTALSFVRSWFLPDLVFMLPWPYIFRQALGVEAQSTTWLMLGFLYLLQLGRMYRFANFLTTLEFRMLLPQTALVVLRNNILVLGSSHVAGCIFYLIARTEQFGEESWVGRNAQRFEGIGVFGRYIYSLYFALAAFTGLGDNDFFVASVPEACFMSAYLLYNLLLGAYILGTVTMLMVKGDKRMKQFRDRVTNLRAYGKLNEVPARLIDAMEAHTELHFHNEQASDEQVLSIYPQTIRRRVLRHLYLDAIRGCYLFKGCSAKYLDLVLSCGRVEQFMPQEQIVAEGDMMNEVYIMLEGQATISTGSKLPSHLKHMASRSNRGQRALSKGAIKRAKSKRAPKLASNAALPQGAATVEVDRQHSRSQSRRSSGADSDGSMTRRDGSVYQNRADSSQRNRTVHKDSGTNWLPESLVMPMSPIGAPDIPTSPMVTPRALGSGIPISAMSPGRSDFTRRQNSFGSDVSPCIRGGGNQTLVRTESASSLNSSWHSSFGGASSADSAMGMNRGASRLPVDWTRSSKLTAGACFGQISFFAEVPSHSSVWSESVIKVLVISRSAYQDLLSTYPQQTRKVLENIEQHAEEEVKREILSCLSSTPSLGPELSAAMHALILGDKAPSQLSSVVMLEIRGMFDKPKRALLDDLGKVKESLAKYVRKVDQEIVYEFLNSCADGDEAAVRAAVAGGMTPNAGDYDKRTGLMLACHSGHIGVVRALLESGADPQLTDNFGGTAMLECVKMGQDALVEVLLEFGGSLGMDGVTIASQLCEHVQSGNLTMLGRMLRAGASATTADYSGMTPLHVAALCSNLAAVRLLVAEGAANVAARNAWGRTALEEAQRLGDTSIVKFLEPLTNAAVTKCDQLAKDMEFLNACSSGNADQVRAGLAAGQAPDTADYDTRTGLMLACHAGHAVIAKLLLQAGAKPNIKDFAGHTAMWECVQMKHPALIEVLLQYQGSLCMSGFQMACMMSQLVADQELEVLRNLIKAGAKPEEADYLGSGPLHVAASLCDLDAVRLLVEEADAIVDMLDVFGRVPLDCALHAESLGHAGAEEVVAYLEPLTTAAQEGTIKSMFNPHGCPAVLMMAGKPIDRIKIGGKKKHARSSGTSDTTTGHSSQDSSQETTATHVKTSSKETLVVTISSNGAGEAHCPVDMPGHSPSQSMTKQKRPLVRSGGSKLGASATQIMGGTTPPDSGGAGGVRSLAPPAPRLATSASDEWLLSDTAETELTASQPQPVVIPPIPLATRASLILPDPTHVPPGASSPSTGLDTSNELRLFGVSPEDNAASPKPLLGSVTRLQVTSARSPSPTKSGRSTPLPDLLENVTKELTGTMDGNPR